MPLTSEQVLVFRTNIKKRSEIQKLRQVLNRRAVIKWNLDFEDVDKVLRVITATLTPDDVIRAVKQKGLECAELE